MSNPFAILFRKLENTTPEHINAGSLVLEQIDDELTDNMRALRLVASLCDHMLSRGMIASDVTYFGLAITSVYCKLQVHIDISYTVLTISQDRGVDREPLTLIRTIAPRDPDYRTLQSLEELARAIKDRRVSLSSAEKQLDAIIATKPLYPKWLIHLSGGGISAGVVMMYTPDPLILSITFLMGAFVSVVLSKLAKYGLPVFYTQAVSGLIIVVIAAATALLAATKLPILNDVNPSLVVIGGIVMLVAGMMIVSAFQDAIDEYYLTASARLLKVMMTTGGIVLGVTMGLYIAARMGADLLLTTPDRLAFSSIHYQYLGAGVLAGAFALQNRARVVGIVCAVAVGFLSLYTSLYIASFGIGTIAATGLSAGVVGLLSVALFHFTKVPTLVTMSAGILPLVPGLTLYSALIYLVQSVPNSSDFDMGISQLFRAILIAISIAAGVTAGAMIGRPARIRLIRAVESLPKPRLSWKK